MTNDAEIILVFLFYISLHKREDKSEPYEILCTVYNSITAAMCQSSDSDDYKVTNSVISV